MSINTYDSVDYATFAADITEARRKADAIYTNVSVNVRPSKDEHEISVDELVDHATMLTALQGVVSPADLSVDAKNQTVLDDGVDAATFNLTGEPNLTVNLRWMGSLVIDTAAVVLDAAGAGSFVVGPYAVGHITDASGINIRCDYQNDIAYGLTCNIVVS